MEEDKLKKNNEEVILPIKIRSKLRGTNYLLFILLFINLTFAVILYIRQINFDEEIRIKFLSEKVEPPLKKEKESEEKLEYDLIVTNLAEYGGPRRYIRIKPILILKKNKNLKEIEFKKNQITDKIIGYLNKLKPADALRLNAIGKIKKSILKILNDSLTHSTVSVIYFQEFKIY